jgi:DNA polymerase-3 subunit delta
MPALNALEISSLKPRLGDNFLILGPDAFLADLATDHIRKELKKQDDVDLVIVYGDDISPAGLNDLLDTYSIFSSAKLILLRKADALEKQHLEPLATYFQDPSPQQSLVIAAEKIDARIGSWKKVRDACQAITCDSPKHSGILRPWLDKALQQLGKTMSFDAKQAFLDQVELDYANANNELQKLAILAGDKKMITGQDVARALGTSRVGTQISFYRALGNRQINEALELMDRMLASELKGLQVLFQIIRFFNSIYNILLLKAAHISAAEISSKHMSDFFQDQRKEYLGFSLNFTLEQMNMIFSILLETDAALKLSLGSDAILLTNCIIRIMGA